MTAIMPRLTSLAGGTVIGLITCGIWTSASAGSPAASPPPVAPAANYAYPNAADPGTIQTAQMPQVAAPGAPTPYASPYPYGNATGTVQPAAAAKAGPAMSTTLSQEELEKLPQRLNNLERTVNQLNGIVNAQAAEMQKTQEETQKKLESGWWTDTKISGRMYYDLSYINNERSDVRQSNSGTGFDIKRFYVGIDHKFTDIFSANITTDFTTTTNGSTPINTSIFIKKAYLDINLDPAFDLRLGSTDLPWIPFLEDLYGLRYIENVMIDRTKFGTSADWGVHAKGKFADGLLNYAFSVVDGAGYKNPDVGVHTNTMDFEGRVNLDYNDFVLAVGGYVGKLGKDIQGMQTFHTAGRFDALAAYKTKQISAGVEYFEAWNFMNVATAASDKADGVSGFVTYHFNPQWGVFGRYDFVQPTKETNSDLKDNYFNVGVEYSPAKIVDFALVYKRDRAGDGSLSTSNGTIGGLTNTTSGTYDEVGIFSRFRW